MLVLSGDFVQASAVRKSAPLAPARGGWRQRWFGSRWRPASVSPFGSHRTAGPGVRAGRRVHRRRRSGIRTYDKRGTHVVVCPGNHDVDWVAARTATPGASTPESRRDFEAVMQPYLRPSAAVPCCQADANGLFILKPAMRCCVLQTARRRAV